MPTDSPEVAKSGAGRRARLQLLGGFALWRRGEWVAPARGEARLIALLGVHDRPLTRRFVTSTLWPGVETARAATRLRSTLHRVRRRLPHVLDQARGPLGLAQGVDVDARRLGRWAHRAIERGSALPHFAEVSLGQELLQGWDEDWVLLERERLRQLVLCALEAVSGRLAAAGEFAAAIAAGRRAVASAPLRESARRALIGALAASGNREAALGQYDEYGGMLARELGMRPSPLLQVAMRDLGLMTSRPGDASVTAAG